MTRSSCLLPIICLAVIAAGTSAQEVGSVRELTLDQERVRERMFELEQRVLEVADLIETERPEVARRLRLALAESRQRFIVAKMSTIRSLLSQEDYGAAAERQRAVLRDLAAFAAMLDPVQSGEELEMLRRAAERIGVLAGRQAEAADRTRAARDGLLPDGLVSEQAAIRQETAILLDELQTSPGSARLTAALRGMEAAEAALAAARAGDALAEQLAAVEELQAALAEVEEAIRRLEEDSVESVRVLLRGLLEQMLNLQTGVRADTVALMDKQGTEVEPGRAYLLAAGELGRRQGELLAFGEQAAGLVEEGGGSPALSAGLAALMDDASTCTDLLARGIVSRSVTSLQEDVQAALMSLLAALAGEMLGPGEDEPAEPREREPGEPRRLLGAHAELRVLGDLQMRLIARTARVEQSRGSAGAERPSAAAEQAAAIGRAQARITGALLRVEAAFREEGMP